MNTYYILLEEPRQESRLFIVRAVSGRAAKAMVIDFSTAEACSVRIFDAIELSQEDEE